MLTKIAIHYATNSKILRRVIIPEVDDNELDHHPPRRGESALLYSRAEFLRLRKADWDFHSIIVAAVTKHTGIAPPNARCVLVHKDTNEILDADFNADPELDVHHSGHRIILHSTAKIGDVWSPK